MDPVASIRLTTRVISLVEFCKFAVTENHQGLSSLLVNTGRGTSERPPETSSISRVVSCLRSLISETKDRGSIESDDLQFVSLTEKCLAQGEQLLALLTQFEATAGDVSWSTFTAGWPGVSERDRVVSIQNFLSVYEVEILDFLSRLLSDENSAVNSVLGALKKETEVVYSVRHHELVALEDDIRSVLGRPNKSKKEKGDVRTRGASLNESSAGSSESQSRRRTKLRRKKKRLAPASTAASTSPSSRTHRRSAGALGQVGSKLQTLCDLAEVIPAEVQVQKRLYYESIDSREHSIHEAESGTFQWMLDEAECPSLPSHVAAARRSFITWLSSGSGVFHISGNAGSGKSTLMKFLGHHSRTALELGRWAGEKKLIFSCFYFWNSGTELQMSLEGLHRSILLEVSRQCPDMIPWLFPEQWKEIQSFGRNAAVSKALFRPETIKAAFESLQQQNDHPTHRMCFFIDGLDEYMDNNMDYWALSKSLRDWASKSHVKICVSARPYPEFLSTFSADLRLHLHELTFDDIKAFAGRSLDNAEPFRLLETDPQVIDEIVRKSEGVFLWVRVVVYSLINLAKLGVSRDEIVRTLEAYPSDIEGLYDRLLGSLGPPDRRRSNQMLLLAARNPFSQPLNALCFAWAEKVWDLNFLTLGQPYSTSQIREKHKTVRESLGWLTKGLLEMHADRRERKDGDQFYRQRVHFFHRTARDYLQSPIRLGEIEHSLGCPDVPELYARLRLAEIVFPGKYPVAKGADPRRRRLYFSYLRSLFGLRNASGGIYQHHKQSMDILKADLQATRSERFNSAYAISCYRSVSDADQIDEDPEKAASFIHLAAAYGQYEYVLSEVKADAHDDDHTELGLLLSAAFGHRPFLPEAFATLLACLPSPSRRINLRQSFQIDPLAATSHQATILMVFVAAVVFYHLGPQGAEQVRKTKNAAESRYARAHFAMLDSLLAKAKEGGPTESTDNRFTFVCMLRPRAKEDDGKTQQTFITSIGQIALLLAPTAAGNILSLLDEANGSDPNTAVAWLNSHLSWASARIQASTCPEFVSHDALKDYSCYQVLSNSETIDFGDGLLFRMY